METLLWPAARENVDRLNPGERSARTGGAEGRANDHNMLKINQIARRQHTRTVSLNSAVESCMAKLGLDSLQNNVGTFPATSTGVNWMAGTETIESNSPVDGGLLGKVQTTTRESYETAVQTAHDAYLKWRSVPAPKRGDIVRQLSQVLRDNKSDLGLLVSAEMGKSFQEGKGEVQEMIDICDFAVGLSRQLYGLTIQSERANHKLHESYYPLGVVGIISAFNFPVAVAAWNQALAWVCGDSTLWKPSEKTPMTALATQLLVSKVFQDNHVPEGVSCLANGGRNVGEWISTDTRIPLVSATGSTKMGTQVAVRVAERLGRSVLELGGNNAVIITPSADLRMVVPGVVFGAVGTAGQRCTSTRRLVVHESVYENVKTSLLAAYSQLKIGNPLDETNHVGPLIDKAAVASYLEALKLAKEQGGRILNEGKVLAGPGYESGCYVTPVIVEATADMPIVRHETFAPILYLLKYTSDIHEAISIQNNVPQGLSSAIMTDSFREAQIFLSEKGSDCGIANVQVGTSGAEIGGAFGGEKETGGGRESGSDAWKIYMRRQTQTLNYGDALPLAQGIKFNL